MAMLDENGNARVRELTEVSDAAAQDEESPLNVALDSSTGAEAAGTGEGGGKSSVSSASFNFINTIVGAGVIGIPYSIYQASLLLTRCHWLLLMRVLQCGFFSGIILLIAFGVATDYSVRLLIDLGVMCSA